MPRDRRYSCITCIKPTQQAFEREAKRRGLFQKGGEEGRKKPSVPQLMNQIAESIRKKEEAGKKRVEVALS